MHNPIPDRCRDELAGSTQLLLPVSKLCPASLTRETTIKLTQPADCSKPQGTTIYDFGGTKLRKKWEALLQEKNLESLPPGKKFGKAFSRKKYRRVFPRETFVRKGVSRNGLHQENFFERPFFGKKLDFPSPGKKSWRPFSREKSLMVDPLTRTTM